MIGTELVYLYRDASNYKFRSKIYLSGQLDKEEILPYLIDQEYFLPDRVGIQSLVPDRTTIDDHEMHEIESISFIEISDSLMKSDDFVERIRLASLKGWFSGASKLD